MAKPIAKRRHDEAERAFRKAWKLLDRIERRLERARAEERKRLTQLGDGTGADAPRRSAQLEDARAEIAQIEGLLTELSELITHNARASSGQTVKDMAHSVAAEIKDEAAEPPQLPTRSRNRHHRPRRKPATAEGASAVNDVAMDSADSAAPSTDGSTPIALPSPRDAGSVDRPRALVVPSSEPARAPKPAPVVYRSLASQPPDRRSAIRPVADPAVPDEAADVAEPGETIEPTYATGPTEGPTSAGNAAPDAGREDPPAAGG